MNIASVAAETATAPWGGIGTAQGLLAKAVMRSGGRWIEMLPAHASHFANEVWRVECIGLGTGSNPVYSAPDRDAIAISPRGLRRAMDFGIPPIDLILCHNEDLFVVAQQLGALADSNVVFCAHGDLVVEHDGTPTSHSLTRRVAESSARVVAFSWAHAAQMEVALGKQVIPIPLPLELLGELDPSRRTKPRSVDLLMAGRAVPAKGWDIGKKVVSALCPPRNADLFIGHGLPDVEDDISRTFELSSHVQVSEWVNPPVIIRALQEARITLVPSAFEPLGLIAAEAMACGSCVVASAVGGLPELIGEEGGILVDPKPGEALAEGCSQAALELLESPDLREEIAHGARKRLKNYAWGDTVAGLAAIANLRE